MMRRSSNLHASVLSDGAHETCHDARRRSSLHNRFSRRAAVVWAVGALLIAVPSAFAGTYFSGSLPSGSSAGSGSNYWSSDTVYRPTGNPYTLWFSNSAGAHQVTSDTYSNPFQITGSWGYDQAWCQNNSNVAVSPTTCIAG